MKKILIVGAAPPLASALESRGMRVRTLQETRDEPLQSDRVQEELDGCTFMLLVSPYNGDDHGHVVLHKEKKFIELAHGRKVKTGVIFDPGTAKRHQHTPNVSLRIVTSVDEHAAICRATPSMRVVLAANMERDASAVASAIQQVAS